MESYSLCKCLEDEVTMYDINIEYIVVATLAIVTVSWNCCKKIV